MGYLLVGILIGLPFLLIVAWAKSSAKEKEEYKRERK